MGELCVTQMQLIRDPSSRLMQLTYELLTRQIIILKER